MSTIEKTADISVRTPWQVTWSVWKALFLREFIARLFRDRMAWFWMLFEPVAHMTLWVFVRVIVMGRTKEIAGAEFIPWVLVGLLGFFLFRENMMRSLNAVAQNRKLYAYRQVKPFDPVVVRSFIEGTIKSFVFVLFVVVTALIGIDMFPDRFFVALAGWVSLWLLGLGIGLVLSVAVGLVSELGNIVRITTFPLLLISGVVFPVNFLPQHLLEPLLYNPILHGVEFIRSGFFASYKTVQGLSVLYLWSWILGLLFVGSMMHIRFEHRLKAK